MQFGTDGIRGRVDVEITESVAYRFGVAVATSFPGATAYLGMDTRESSSRLARAAMAGVRDGGSTAVNLGVITTPGVAVIAERRGGVGIVVSASHNPYLDNGLKVFGIGGAKLEVDEEARVQAAFDAAVGRDGPFDEVEVSHSGAVEYLSRLGAVLTPDALAGLRIVIDCAHGAASDLAPSVFRALGAEVEEIAASPDGTNINFECGSTHPQFLAEVVRERHADLGLALDGDGDRLIAVDSHGTVHDGDDLMVLFARDLEERDRLGGGLVVTVLSNLGLHRAMRDARIRVVETDVGDRAVVSALREHGLSFGGEQSGHLVFRTLWPTGDGILSGLLLADLVRRRGRLSELCDEAWRRLPQRMINIPRDDFSRDAVDASLSELAERHGISRDDYRLLVRPSGTEPVVRVMIESSDATLVDEFIDLVATRSGVRH